MNIFLVSDDNRNVDRIMNDLVRFGHSVSHNVSILESVLGRLDKNWKTWPLSRLMQEKREPSVGACMELLENSIARCDVLVVVAPMQYAAHVSLGASTLTALLIPDDQAEAPLDLSALACDAAFRSVADLQAWLATIPAREASLAEIERFVLGVADDELRRLRRALMAATPKGPRAIGGLISQHLKSFSRESDRLVALSQGLDETLAAIEEIEEDAASNNSSN